MQSLRDKLLKAGLVSKEQVEKAEQKSEANARPLEKRPKPAGTGGRSVPKLPPLPGSPEHQRLEAKKQLAVDRKIRELVSRAQVALELGARTFYFVTRKSRLRRLELSEGQADRLERGELAVVERPDPDKIEHALVPSEIAAEISKLSSKAVRYLNRKESPVGFLTEDELARHQLEDQTEVEAAK